MQRLDFSYQLPEDRIAKVPCSERSDSRMLLLDPVTNKLRDSRFRDFPGLLERGDLVIFNDTRVIPARLFGHKSTGGRVEVLVERILGDGCVLAHVRSSKPVRPGTRLQLDGGNEITVTGREGQLYRLQFAAGTDVPALLDAIGHVPLPPYLDRPDTNADRERYQTVYARQPGAVAAPTAGLHFDRGVLDRLADRGVQSAYVTLHVGTGTFQPVRVDNLDEHVMHREVYGIPRETAELVARTRCAGGRVIAVGTTVVRTLEAAVGVNGELMHGPGETDLFIRPGYPFSVVDALLTNFHLPESTLLMLVCAFAGYRLTMDAYAHAIATGYRFYSYGDAMFISTRQQAG